MSDSGRHEPSKDYTAAPFPWSCILSHSWRTFPADYPIIPLHWIHQCTRCGQRARHLKPFRWVSRRQARAA